MDNGFGMLIAGLRWDLRNTVTQTILWQTKIHKPLSVVSVAGGIQWIQSYLWVKTRDRKQDIKMRKGKALPGLFLGVQTSIFLRLISQVQQITTTTRMISPLPRCVFPLVNQKNTVPFVFHCSESQLFFPTSGALSVDCSILWSGTRVAGWWVAKLCAGGIAA